MSAARRARTALAAGRRTARRGGRDGARLRRRGPHRRAARRPHLRRRPRARAAPTGCWPRWPTPGRRATFFVLLTRVRKYPALLRRGRRRRARGRAARRRPPRPAHAAPGRGRPAWSATAGPSWRTPPARRSAGSGRPTAGRRCATGAPSPAAGLLPVLWGPTTWDWKDVSPEERVAKAHDRACAPGAIVLAHDGFAGPEDGACDGPPPQLDRGELIAVRPRRATPSAGSRPARWATRSAPGRWCARPGSTADLR